MELKLGDDNNSDSCDDYVATNIKIKSIYTV